MPRAAATMFGLALVAFSIGFNTLHWPIVWREVGEAMAAAPTHETSHPTVDPAEAARLAAEPRPMAEPTTSPKPVEPPVPLAIKPVPDAERAPRDGPTPIRAETASVPVAVEKTASKDDSMLVPVPPVRVPKRSTPDQDATRGIRRLPPVEQVEPSSRPDDGSLINGVMPLYPNTGIE